MYRKEERRRKKFRRRFCMGGRIAAGFVSSPSGAMQMLTNHLELIEVLSYNY